MTPLYADLVERLERASEGSRELDVAIWWACEPIKARDTVKCAMDRPGAVQQLVEQDRAPKYSSSLDAALQLVPEGYDDWTMGTTYSEDDSLRYFATLSGGVTHCNSCQQNKFVTYTAHMKTLPLALVIASLKARAFLSPPQKTET